MVSKFLAALALVCMLAAPAYAAGKCESVGQVYDTNKAHVADLKLHKLTPVQTALAASVLKQFVPDALTPDAAYLSWSNDKPEVSVVVFFVKGCFKYWIPISPEDRGVLLKYKGHSA